ncbi:MAG: DAK2 domain protein [Firmicutes bacterium ADurb.Bin193]|nr:MAG: DAK2 domain protein [Firmicutes bacterium ADurb.Bin193]
MPDSIDGVMLKKAIINASNNLVNHKKSVDDMNVFPVPDGDTGTNMAMTISSAAREVLAQDSTSVAKVADCAASAALRGARGNSGVILSQLFRGFAKGVAGKDEVNATELAAAIKSASDMAYKAVMKPTEGTILTVARAAADKAVSIAEQTPDITEFATLVVEAAKETLDKTPDMLPVLKQAGVVDAGGMGLVIIIEGVISALKGEEITIKKELEEASEKRTTPIDTDNIKFIYCTEFLITKKSLNYSIRSFTAAIERVGDSMLVIEEGELVKVHIHTNRPGYVLEQAVKIGELSGLKIDNMKIQHSETIETKPESPPKKYGIVAVASGSGLERIFSDIGVDEIVRGGQSMNPSTEDILRAVSSVNAETIFVLPNNKNIILAAQQAAEISDKNIIVIPSRTIPQGISAVLMFDEGASAEDNKKNMEEAAFSIKTGQVTFAARDSEIDGMKIKEGDIMGMEDGKITMLGTDPGDVAAKVIDNLADDGAAVITIFYGNGVKDSEAEELATKVRGKYTRCDVLSHDGGQPLYHYIISVE